MGYVENQAWQIEDADQGIAEADRGEFASDSEVNTVFAKYGGLSGPERRI
jgi:predicted transcriptional regulator